VSRIHWQGTRGKPRIETFSAGIPSRDVGPQDLTPTSDPDHLAGRSGCLHVAGLGRAVQEAVGDRDAL